MIYLHDLHLGFSGDHVPHRTFVQISHRLFHPRQSAFCWIIFFFFLHGKICLLGAVSVPSFDILRHYFPLHIGHTGKRSHRDNTASDKLNVQHRLKFATWRYRFSLFESVFLNLTCCSMCHLNCYVVFPACLHIIWDALCPVMPLSDSTHPVSWPSDSSSLTSTHWCVCVFSPVLKGVPPVWVCAWVPAYKKTVAQSPWAPDLLVKVPKTC